MLGRAGCRREGVAAYGRAVFVFLEGRAVDEFDGIALPGSDIG